MSVNCQLLIASATNAHAVIIECAIGHDPAPEWLQHCNAVEWALFLSDAVLQLQQCAQPPP